MLDAPTLSTNFEFLTAHSPHLTRLVGQAERYLADDANTSLVKLRQFAELLAQRIAANTGMYASTDDKFADLIGRLRGRNVIGPDVARLFHSLRVAGNAAAHSFQGDYDQALQHLKLAHALSIWFHRVFGADKTFTPPAFIVPLSTNEKAQALQTQLAKLEQELEAARATSNEAQIVAREEALARVAAEAKAELAAKQHAEVLAAAQEAEAQFEAERQRVDQEMTALQAQAQPQDLPAIIQQSQTAELQIELDEAATRRLIDEQLNEAGWETDTQNLTYAKGARPQKGKNLAIAEWPTEDGKADYVLFAGLTPVAVVEAKRKNKDVAGAIQQAKRYSRAFKFSVEQTPPGGPWGEYRIPFLFSTNGRPFLRQLIEKSGIWFHDVRRTINHPRALENWYTPDGLTALLAKDDTKADQALAEESFAYMDLRGYQKDAIRAVEQALMAGERQMLVAMATGTGKTRTCIGLVYRLVKARRFRRVLFLVDRSALGEQTENAFKDMRLENLQTFSDIYDVKGLGDIVPDSDTRLHIATVQGLVKRLLYSGENAAPAIDQYDCIVVDECHRGYNLDKGMTEGELVYRNENDYISTYRRVLDHFDAVKIGLTATPALHTTEIFGKPVYQYSYRQAVVDGYLIDHEPPIRIVTALAEDGMHWKAGETMEVYQVKQLKLDLVNLPDEVNVEIEAFNRKVVTENFNRVVCDELARQIDPYLPGKTLIFCANEDHADRVVRLLKRAYDAHGGIDDDAIVKITGSVDKPLEMIRRYKNEQLPKIVVTVDLLTTGVDVPEITNVVFLRRVRSRILYEQMLGRATRLCPDIDKDVFRIFDAVDLYAALEDVTSMGPVGPQPGITFVQLVTELTTLETEDHRQEVFEQLIAKLRRKVARMGDDETVEALAGVGPKALVKQLRDQGPVAAADWFKSRLDLAIYLDKARPGGGPQLIVSHHEDELRRVERGYGKASKPEDYLESFSLFIQENMNLIPALIVVTQRPRDLTRQQLKDLKLALDQAGYNEAALRTAWHEMTNEDIAASIIGFIRQRALGSPLVPYGERVDAALKRILASRAWTKPQADWLKRIGAQLKQEVIVDHEAMDQGQFKTYGGFARIDKVFDGQLGTVLGDLQDQIWKDAG